MDVRGSRMSYESEGISREILEQDLIERGMQRGIKDASPIGSLARETSHCWAREISRRERRRHEA